MHYSIIVAMAENGVMGRDGGLPWRQSSDLKLVRKLTMGKPLIMGRKTFATLPHALDGRDNIVVTRKADFQADGAIIVPNIEAAYAKAEESAAARDAHEIIIFGGAQIYAAALPIVTRLYVSEIHGDVEGDTYFPALDWTAWDEVSREKFTASEKDDFDFSLVVLERRQ